MTRSATPSTVLRAKPAHAALPAIMPVKACPRKTAQFQSLLNHRGKVPCPLRCASFRVRYHRRGEHTVSIACFWRHQQLVVNSTGVQFWHFLPLVLPCCAEIALEVGILFQLRIAVSGKHFAVSVDVDVLSLGLLQNKLEIVEVMSRYVM